MALFWPWNRTSADSIFHGQPLSVPSYVRSSFCVTTILQLLTHECIPSVLSKSVWKIESSVISVSTYLFQTKAVRFDLLISNAIEEPVQKKYRVRKKAFELCVSSLACVNGFALLTAVLYRFRYLERYIYIYTYIDTYHIEPYRKHPRKGRMSTCAMMSHVVNILIKPNQITCHKRR